MAPTPATSALAYIKQCKPVLRGEVSKIAYLMHTYAVLSDCNLIGIDEAPGDSSAREMEMPAELDKQDFASLHYRTPNGSRVEIAVMRADNELLLHWAEHSGEDASAAPVHSVSIPQGTYFADSESGADAYQREKVPELMDKFTAGLDIVFQAKESSTAASQDTATASRPQQTDTTRPDHVTAPPPAGPLHAFHPQPSPLMDGVPARGGSHVGPDDPMFAGVVHSRPGRMSGNPPGARFDPIAPDGLPGSHPDDFMGPGQVDGWHDLGPPPGRGMPDRRRPGQDPFGGFM